MSEDTKKSEQAEQKPTKTTEPASTDLKEEDLEQVSGGDDLFRVSLFGNSPIVKLS
jgi:hypothetical protein